MVGGFKRQRHTAFVAYGKRFQRGYGMLTRLDVGADSRMFNLVIDDNLVGIAIQRHALSKLIFGRNDNLFATRELDRALGCTTVRVELAYGMLLAELLRPKRCQCGAVPDANLLRREEKRQVTVGEPNLTMAVFCLI